MSQIKVSDLSFTYEGSLSPVFENVSFQMDTNWKLGFTGRNGRGKTTFCKLLLGEYPYQGTITHSTAFTYFPFPVEDPTQLTAYVAEELAPDHEPWQLQRELSLLEVDEDVLWRPFDTLSNGERTKVMLAALFLRENHFLLIDEPTNHLDARGRRLVADYLARKKGFLLISHDRAFLDGCVDHILSINKTDIQVVQGIFSTWMENKERQDAFEQSRSDALRKDIKRLEKTAREKAVWADKVEATKTGTRNAGLRPDRGYIGHKAAKMMQRSKNLENRQNAAIAEKKGLLQNVESAEELKLHPLEFRKSRLVEVKDLSIAYDGRQVCAGVDFEIAAGERVCLAGGNGSGKSSLLKLLMGEEIPHTGAVQAASGLKISYVPQSSSGLSGSLDDFIRDRQVEESLFKAILRKLDFSRELFTQPMERYSEGQKKKVLLAGSLCDQAHLYIWDEPLNYIDVISRMQIEDLLLAYEPTLLFVEHDAAFCQHVATRVVELG